MEWVGYRRGNELNSMNVHLTFSSTSLFNNDVKNSVKHLGAHNDSLIQATTRQRFDRLHITRNLLIIAAKFIFLILKNK